MRCVTGVPLGCDMSLRGAAGGSFTLSTKDTSSSKHPSTVSRLSIQSLVVKMMIKGWNEEASTFTLNFFSVFVFLTLFSNVATWTGFGSIWIYEAPKYSKCRNNAPPRGSSVVHPKTAIEPMWPLPGRWRQLKPMLFQNNWLSKRLNDAN